MYSSHTRTVNIANRPRSALRTSPTTSRRRLSRARQTRLSPRPCVPGARPLPTSLLSQHPTPNTRNLFRNRALQRPLALPPPTRLPPALFCSACPLRDCHVRLQTIQPALCCVQRLVFRTSTLSLIHPPTPASLATHFFPPGAPLELDSTPPLPALSERLRPDLLPLFRSLFCPISSSAPSQLFCARPRLFLASAHHPPLQHRPDCSVAAVASLQFAPCFSSPSPC